MVTVRKADPALMDKGSQRPRDLSPAARERDQQQRQFKKLISQLKGPEQVFEVRLDLTEKPITIRQRLLQFGDAGGRDSGAIQGQVLEAAQRFEVFQPGIRNRGPRQFQ